MSSLGIYFGPKIIHIIELKGRKVINSVRMNQPTSAESELEEKVPEEIKLVVLLKEELRKIKSEAKEATLALSGSDFIVRTFEMPALPEEELGNAVNFEAKKYIPFKIEDLTTDFQTDLDKVSRKNLVLFVGIKKGILEKYFSVFSQLGIKVNFIEHSVFGLLRFIQFIGAGDKGVVSIISVEFQDEEESHFTVLDNGFPVFSRDITLFTKTEMPSADQGPDPKAMLEKLKTEIRISLDYYDRKFPSKNVGKIIIIVSDNYRPDLEAYIKELGLPVECLDVKRYWEKPETFNLGFLKGYGSSLSKTVKTRLKIDLVAAKAKSKGEKMQEVSSMLEARFLLTRLKIDFRVTTLSLIICLGVFAFGLLRALPLQKELDNIVKMRPEISNIPAAASYEELTAIGAQYKNKMKSLDEIMKKYMYLTEQLDALPRILPEGMWLTDFLLRSREAKLELVLRGLVYLGDANKEFESVNRFLSYLKDNPAFNRYFKNINITSIEGGEFKKIKVTKFTVSCINSHK